MYHLKKQVDGFHLKLKVFDGRETVRIISFLTTLRVTFDTIGVCEDTAGRTLAYFMGRESKDVLPEKFEIVKVNFDGGSPETSDQRSWNDVVLALLRRFTANEVLRKAHDEVVRVEQTDRRGECQLAYIIYKEARL